MSDGINVELGTALQYIEDKARAAFGYDHASIETRQLLDRHLRLAIQDAAAVQIIGMYRPISIFDIYQPLDLVGPTEHGTVTPISVVRQRRDVVVFGGPGRGKTIFLHYLFATIAKSENVIPLLFTLRWPGAPSDLVTFVDYLDDGRIKRCDKILLLVDGFDEITAEERQDVVHALRRFAAHQAGTFIMTCRSFYHVYDLKADYYDLAPFSKHDSVGFINAFSRAYGATINAPALLRELEEHRFGDFAAHPLMLAMVCILKSGPMPELPQTPIRLIRRALDTLTLRWDDQKGVRRNSRLNLDGDDRVRGLMFVAYRMQELVGTTTYVEHVTHEYLQLLHRPDIAGRDLLHEIAQWYGIFVPVSDSQWTFVHRTIHDYLAARYWVESGTFAPAEIKDWTPRAAYAACLVPDATRSILQMLAHAGDNDSSALAECFYNRPLFNGHDIATAVVQYLERALSIARTTSSANVCISARRSIVNVAPDELLISMLKLGAGSKSAKRNALVALTLGEVITRGRSLPQQLTHSLSASLGRDTAYAVTSGDRAVLFTMRELMRQWHDA